MKKIIIILVVFAIFCFWIEFCGDTENNPTITYDKQTVKDLCENKFKDTKYFDDLYDGDSKDIENAVIDECKDITNSFEKAHEDKDDADWECLYNYFDDISKIKTEEDYLDTKNNIYDDCCKSKNDCESPITSSSSTSTSSSSSSTTSSSGGSSTTSSSTTSSTSTSTTSSGGVCISSCPTAVNGSSKSKGVDTSSVTGLIDIGFDKCSGETLAYFESEVADSPFLGVEASTCKVVKYTDRLDDGTLSNDPSPAYAINICYDAVNHVFMLKSNSQVIGKLRCEQQSDACHLVIYYDDKSKYATYHIENAGVSNEINILNYSNGSQNALNDCQ